MSFPLHNAALHSAGTVDTIDEPTSAIHSSARLHPSATVAAGAIIEVEVDVRTSGITKVEARLHERIAQVEVSIHKAMAAPTRWLIRGLAILDTIFKLADLFIGP